MPAPHRITHNRRQQDKQLIDSLIEALSMAINLIDRYEAPRKAQCGASSFTRIACERVLRIAKERQ